MACAALPCAVVCCAALCSAVLCCPVLCCAALCCAAQCCAALCCAALCCAMLPCAVLYRCHCVGATTTFLKHPFSRLCYWKTSNSIVHVGGIFTEAWLIELSNTLLYRIVVFCTWLCLIELILVAKARLAIWLCGWAVFLQRWVVWTDSILWHLAVSQPWSMMMGYFSLQTDAVLRSAETAVPSSSHQTTAN